MRWNVKQSLLRILTCPICKGNLNLTMKSKDEEIAEGSLTCSNCHTNYPIHNYIPRFVHSDKYAKSFSMQWNWHGRTQLDSFSGTHESEDTFKTKTGFDLEKLKGKLVLDVGCGAGRFTEVAGKYGAEVMAIDLSFSVNAAFENLGSRRNIHIIQADIFSLPFKEESFDYIFSIGVLDHTPNTREAFNQLPRLLKKGGEIAIWIYSDEGIYRKLHNRISNFYRVFTTRMPKSLLYYLCHISIPLYHLNRVRILGALLNLIVPISCHPNSEWRVLDTFDWYSPKYQWKHTYNEVVRWFEEKELKNITKLNRPVSVKGKRVS